MPSPYFQIISGEKRGFGAALSRLGLATLTIPYGIATTLRNLAYDFGFTRTHTASVPVISLGNLTTGGTGKTPIAAWLATQFIKAGFTPAIVSRGYHADASGKNDEALVLELLIPNVNQIRNQDRVAGAQSAIAAGANLIILDDGYQHRRLHRDFNLLLIDALNPFGFNHLLPRGLLRESLAGARRADLILLTRADLVPETTVEEILSRLRHIGCHAPAIRIAFQPDQLISHSGQTLPLNALADQKALSFCGIGNPAGFWRTLAPWTGNQTPAQQIAFPDHHHYSRDDLKQIAQRASDLSADLLITTHKDLVKIARDDLEDIPLYALNTGVTLIDPKQEWPRFLEAILARIKST